jgi:hypothetical protein
MQDGCYVPAGASLLDTNTYYGLGHTDTWLDTYLTSASGQYFITTHHMAQGANGSLTEPPSGLSIGLMSTPLGYQMVPDPNFKPWTSETQESLHDGDVTYFITDPTTTEQLTYGAKSISWTSSDGMLNIHGTLTAPGNSYFMRTPPASVSTAPSDFLYGNVYYRVSGNYHGQAVHGYLMIENLWSETEYDSNYWVKNRVVNWLAWTDTFTNGTTEYGQFFCGDDGYTGAVITNNTGQLLVDTHELTATEESKDPLGTPLLIHYVLGNGMQFNYIGNEQHVAIAGEAAPSLGTELADGRVVQVGDKRAIKESDAIQLITKGIPASCETGSH